MSDIYIFRASGPSLRVFFSVISFGSHPSDYEHRSYLLTLVFVFRFRRVLQFGVLLHHLYIHLYTYKGLIWLGIGERATGMFWAGLCLAFISQLGLSSIILILI